MGPLPLSSVLGKGAAALHVRAHARGKSAASIVLPTVARIGLESLHRQGEYGAIAEIGVRHGVDRDFVKECERRVRECLSLLEKPLVSSSSFLLNVQVDREQLLRATVGARVDANSSVRGIMGLHEHFYGLDVSFGWVQGALTHAARLAASKLSEQCLNQIDSGALDELFGQREPVLVGIDLDSEYVFLLKHTQDRKARTWASELLALQPRGLLLRRFVCDAGKGLCSGAEEAFPQASSRRDPFHVLDVLFDALGREERYAYAKLEELYAFEEKVGRLNRVVASLKELPHARVGRPTMTPIEAQLKEKSRELDELRRRVEHQLTRHDRLLTLLYEVMEILEFISPDGQFYNSSQAASRLKAIALELKELRGNRLEKAATYLSNCAEAVCSYIDEMRSLLLAVTDDEREKRVVRSMAVLWRLAKEEQKSLFAWRRSERLAEASALVKSLGSTELEPERVKMLMSQTQAAISRRARASSLVECVNSVLRPYLAVHKRVTQEALDLFCFRWNFRKRTDGKLKGTCPYTALTGVKVHDWLSHLGLTQNSPLH